LGQINMAYGYAGTILHIDLSTSAIRKESLDLEIARKFIGGFGINQRLAYEHMSPGVDPLSPENVIIIGAGCFGGTLTPGSSRCSATTKMPLNGAIASAIGSMHFGHQLKWAGYDHVVITGKAKWPVYLKIFDDEVEIADAKHLWD